MSDTPDTPWTGDRAKSFTDDPGDTSKVYTGPRTVTVKALRNPDLYEGPEPPLSEDDFDRMSLDSQAECDHHAVVAVCVHCLLTLYIIEPLP
jgi:hypothetical protein